MTATIRIGGLRGFLPIIEQFNGDARALCDACGVDVEIFEADEEALISYRVLSDLLEYTAHKLDIPDLGLRIAASHGIDALGPLALAIQNSKTVAHAMHCAASYLFVHTTALDLNIVGLGDITELRVKIGLKNFYPENSCQASDKAIAVVHGVLKILAKDSYQPLSVALPHAPLCEPRVYEDYFGAKVSFNCAQSVIRLNTHVMATSLEGRNDHIRQIALKFLREQQPTIERTLKAQVENLIIKSLGTKSCNRDDVAAALSMHPRTMQRQLNVHGLCFVEIRDSIRKSRASHYLHETEVPLSQVASIIGYSDQSILTRSCQRWFNATPLQIRGMHH